MKILAFLMFPIAVWGQTTPLSFTNKPFSDPEMPNYHRGAQYWNGTSWGTGSAPQVPPGNPTTGAKALYSRYWWNWCEAGQGQYTFTKASLGSNSWRSIEAGLEWCANNGALYAFGGVMTAWDAQGEIFYDGGWAVYPQYLHNLMQAEVTTKDWKYSGYNCWVPNWNSPSYLARWKALNDTLKRYMENWKYTPSSGPWAGKQILGKNIIDFVDLRGYGNYGEWHNWPWGSDGSEPSYAKVTDSTIKKIIDIGVDIYGDYPMHIPVAAFDDNPWGGGTAFQTWYSLTLKTRYGVLGWRRDNIGDPGLDGFLIGNTFTGPNGWKADTAILDRWKQAMIVGEPLNGNGSCCPYYYHIRQELNTYHYATFGNGNYGSTAQSVFDSMQVYFKMTGYRYNFSGGSMTTTLVNGQPFNISLNWRNVGVSPLYQKRWRVVYELKSGTQTVQRFVSKFSPYLFLPSSKDSVVNEDFIFNNVAPGSYNVTVKIEDTVGLLAPLFLAVNNPVRNTDGSYTLRSGVTVTAALPVKWLDVAASPVRDGVLVSWTVTCDEDTKLYEVQRSTDGDKFVTIATFTPTANCNTEKYSYTDVQVPPSAVYYRIRHMSIDGEMLVSKLVRVNTRVDKGVVFYPNPANDHLNIVVNNDITGEVNIMLYSPDGRLIAHKAYTKYSQSVFYREDISTLMTGMYIIKVMQANRLQKVGTFIKK